MDRIELEFRTNSTFSSFDGTLRGSKAKGKSYQMRPVQEPNEGKWLWLRWSGEVPEWELHGVSTKLKEEEPSSNGHAGADARLSQLPCLTKVGLLLLEGAATTLSADCTLDGHVPFLYG
jgi:hypothetical protein